MSTFESFTEDEIVQVFSLACDEITIEYPEEDEYGGPSLFCKAGEISFICYLEGEEPFFNQLNLRATRFIPVDPYKFCNRHNQGPGFSRAFVTEYDDVWDEDDDLLFFNDDVEELILNEKKTNAMVRLFIPFGTGLTQEYILFLLYMWIEELSEFFEINSGDDDLDLDMEAGVEVPQSPEFLELSLVERVSVYLSLNSDRTAREMSKVLGFDRHEINSVLYKHRDRFVKNKSQPPQWNLKGND
jgi:hypothetical protein